MSDETRALVVKALNVLGGDTSERPGDMAIIAAKATLRSLIDAVRAEPSRSSPDPDLLRAHLRSTSRVAHNAMHHDRIDGTWETCQHEPCVGDRRVLDRRLSRLGSSPDLTGLDAVSRYVALHDPDGECNGKCSAWAALRALAARLPPAPETDPSQVER